MRRLNRAVFGRGQDRFGKRLRVIPVLEKDHGGRFHYHLAIEPPAGIDGDQFAMKIRDCWKRIDWGYNEIDIQRDADRSWVDNYMLKLRQKSGLEAWVDCIDWGSLHNP